MGTSRAVRPKKKVLNPVVETHERSKKTPTRIRILNALKKYPNGLPMSEIGYKSGISSMGNLYNNIRFMLSAKEVEKESCPHCNHTVLYKAVI